MNQQFSMPDWGPYSSHYAGISCVLNTRGEMVDFVFCPSCQRGRTMIPDVNFDAGVHIWDATADLTRYTYRYELEWKDRQYVDVTFIAHPDGRLVQMTFVNNTSLSRDYSQTVFAVHRPIDHVTVDEENALWIGGELYESLDFVEASDTARGGENYEAFSHIGHLTMGKDGLRKGVCMHGHLVGQMGLGNAPYDLTGHYNATQSNQTFLMTAGTTITYMTPGGDYSKLSLRYHMTKVQTLSLKMHIGDQAYSLCIDGEKDLEAPGEMRILSIPITNVSGELILTVDEARYDDQAGFMLDGILLSNDVSDDETARRFRAHSGVPRFAVSHSVNGGGVVLRSERSPGLRLAMYSEAERPIPPFPYSDCTVTEVFHSELSGAKILRKLSNDALTNWGWHNCRISGDGENHFCGYNLMPIIVPPGKTKTVYLALVCDQGGMEETFLLDQARRICADHTLPEAPVSHDSNEYYPSEYDFSQRLLRSALYTNIAHPVWIKGKARKTYTPGKRWSSLFTWDSGMLGIGLAQYAPECACDILDQYFPDADSADVDAVIHGSPLPLHIYLLWEIYQNTGEKTILSRYYDRAMQYYSYFSGKSRNSVYNKFHTGLLCPFEDGYSPEGIDDYPAQHHVGMLGQYDRYAPACTSAHAIRVGKIMQMIRYALGLSNDPEIDQWNDYLADALRRHAWDESSGYFGYVDNDTMQILTANGQHPANFNMGIDGASPLLSGITTREQTESLIHHLMTTGRMWTEYGITSVDQAAPYFRIDGYWNGKVWIPHQWFFFKALLSHGYAEEALKIAQTALSVWKKSSDDTYNCYELFCSQTGMGEGCSQFGGLSAPVAAFYGALYGKKRVTVGFDTLVEGYNEDAHGIAFALKSPHCKGMKRIGALATVPNLGRYRLAIDDDEMSVETTGYVLPIVLEKPRSCHRVSICAM